MKRKIPRLTALLLAAVTLFSACAGGGGEDTGSNDFEGEESEEYSHFLYTNEKGTIVRYDVDERKAAIACPDPLCKHDTEDCLVSHVTELMHVTNDYIAYVKENEALNSTLYLYEIETGAITSIKSDASQFYYPWVSSDSKYVFFCAANFVFDDVGNTESEIWSVYRFDIELDEYSLLSENIGNAYSVVKDTGNKILWEGDDYFWTDYDFNNIEICDYQGYEICGYHIHSEIERNERGDFCRTIYKENSKTGREKILDNVSHARYYKFGSTAGLAYTTFNYDSEYDYNHPSEIWYYDLVDSESRKLIDVADISDEFDIAYLTLRHGYSNYINGYMMISIGHTYTFVNESGNSEMSAEYTHELFINAATGDWFIIEIIV